MKTGEFHIATSTENEAYFVPMYVMLSSLFKNNSSLSFCVHILYNDLNNAQQNNIEALATEYNNRINWIQVADEKIKTYYTSVYVTTATYYRVLAASLLPDNVDKVLFLDADIVVNGSIEELLRINMERCPVMAVREVIPHKIERLNIPDTYDYFNAGVLLLNVKEWRANHYSEKVLANIEKEHSNYMMFDQDALNAFFYDKVKFIASKWNHQTGFYHLTPKELGERYNEDAGALLNQPVIIHFIGAYKPWHYICTHPFKPLFLQYLLDTPFKGFSEKATMQKWFYKISIRVRHKLEKLF